MKKYLYNILLIIIILLLIIFYYYLSLGKNLEIIFFDVGQGDSALIKTPYGQNILIDGGPDASVLYGLSSHLLFWDRTIDLMIISHPHDDHISGLIEVLGKYNVENVLFSNVKYESAQYEVFLNILKENEINTKVVNKKSEIEFSEDCNMKIVYPDKSFENKIVDNINNTSIVSLLDCELVKVLFTGDIEKRVEEYIIGSGADFDTDILKIAHHGSDTSTIDEFLEKSTPIVSIISVGDNDFGHPNKRILNRTKKNGSEILRTDISGSIMMKIDDGIVEIGNMVYEVEK